MKVFHSDKYQYFDIVSCDDQLYYAFRCTKKDFSPEIVLVRQARVDFGRDERMYFDEYVLDDVKEDSKLLNSIRVNLQKVYASLDSLAENESNRYDRRTYSEVFTLTQIQGH